MVCHFLNVLDTDMRHAVLETVFNEMTDEDYLQTLSRIERVNTIFKGHAEELWKSLAIKLNVPLASQDHPKLVIKEKILELRTSYPDQLVKQLGLFNMLEIPVLEIPKSKSFNSNIMQDRPLVIKPDQLREPLMKGVDGENRHFISILCEGKNNQKSVITLHRQAVNSKKWTFSQGNGIYSMIQFSHKDPNFLKIKDLLADKMILAEAPNERINLKKSK